MIIIIIMIIVMMMKLIVIIITELAVIIIVLIRGVSFQMRFAEQYRVPKQQHALRAGRGAMS